MNFRAARFARLLVFCMALTCSGCRSYWINAEVQNLTGKSIHQLEVDYPTASFGTNSLTPEASFRYRVQIRGSGPIKVEYTFEDGTVIHAQGLNLEEHQQGELTIRLMPQGKVEFLPKLKPAP